MYELSNPDDHQWIGQILLSSLAYKGEMKVKERHSIDNYGKQIKGLNLPNINLTPSDLERRQEPYSYPDDRQGIDQTLHTSLRTEIVEEDTVDPIENGVLPQNGELGNISLDQFPIENGVLPQNGELGAESNNQDNRIEPVEITQPSPNNEEEEDTVYPTTRGKLVKIVTDNAPVAATIAGAIVISFLVAKRSF